MNSTQVFQSGTDTDLMIRFLFLILALVCVSCGKILPGKELTRMPASVAVTPPPYEQRLFLSVLEEKYASEKKTLNLSIVRGMILRMEEKWPELHSVPSEVSSEEVRKLPAFRSLEMTVEHLSHREYVKIHTRHSAFHAVP